MPLAKGFLRAKFIHEIPKYKYFVGIIIGLLMAFSLYALQYMTRELMRVSSASETDIWMLNDAEVNFYNLIFALIALIVGQSFCLEYWFNRPKKSLKARPGRLQSIIHEQRFMNWYVLSWFNRVATMYGLMFCTAGLADFYIMSLYPDYNYILVLMVIVIFLQTWNSLLLTFKLKAFKWMFFSSVTICILSFGLSKIDIVNYKVLNDKIINNRLDVKYHLRLPKSTIYSDENYQFRNLPNISLVTSKGDDSTKPLLFVGQEEIAIAKLPQEVLQIKERQHYELQNFMPTFLRIDKEVPMSFVHELKRELAFVNFYRLNYLIIPADAKYNEKYYTGTNRAYLSQLNPAFFDTDHRQLMKWANEVSNRIEISINNNGYIVDGFPIPLNELAEELRKRLVQNLDYAMILNFTENIDFWTYFGLISKINEAIYKLRDEEAFKVYGMDFKTLKEKYSYGGEGIRENIRAIQAKYPVKCVENWNESGIRLPKKSQPDFALPEIP